MKLLTAASEYIINSLEQHGYQSYIVGGALRDMLMNKEPNDTDITTDASPEQVKNVFKKHKVIETGIRHGTVTVLIEGTPVEITTFRTENGYSDGRHPDEVSFTANITDDLRRRDFTMNSIAYSPFSGLVDPFGGKEDIDNCIIRCVGNPQERFREDGLRILRALRFSSVLGFKIEQSTSDAIFSCKDMLKNISVERIYSELIKMLCGKHIKEILIQYSDIISEFIPEVGSMKNFDQHNFHHKYDLLGHTAVVVQNIEPIPHLRLAALFHDIAKPLCLSFDNEGIGHFYKHPSIGADVTNCILLRMHSDTLTREKVVKLIKWHDTPIEENEKIIKKKLRTMGEEMLRDLIKLQRADTKGLADEFQNRSEHFNRLEEIIKEVILEQQCFSLKDLAVNGNDISALGYKGKDIGDVLNKILDDVIENRVKNEKCDILSYINKGR